MTRCADYGHGKLLIWQNFLFGTSKGQNFDNDNQLSPIRRHRPFLHFVAQRWLLHDELRCHSLTNDLKPQVLAVNHQMRGTALLLIAPRRLLFTFCVSDGKVGGFFLFPLPPKMVVTHATHRQTWEQHKKKPSRKLQTLNVFPHGTSSLFFALIVHPVGRVFVCLDRPKKSAERVTDFSLSRHVGAAGRWLIGGANVLALDRPKGMMMIRKSGTSWIGLISSGRFRPPRPNHHQRTDRYNGGHIEHLKANRILISVLSTRRHLAVTFPLNPFGS